MLAPGRLLGCLGFSYRAKLLIMVHIIHARATARLQLLI